MGTSVKGKSMQVKRSNYGSWLAFGLVLFLLQGCNISQKSNDTISISPVLEREDHLFLEDGPIEFKIEIGNQTRQSLDGKLVLTVSSDFGVEIPGATLEIEVNSGASQVSEIDLGSLNPGFYNVEALVQSDVGNKQVKFAFGVRPEEIISPLDRPNDFEAYWIRTKKELREVDPRFKLIRQDSLCTEKREVFILEMYSLGEVLVRAWYMRPVKEGIYPAVLHVQGYSSFMIPDWMYQGDDMVALGLNIRGHGFSQDQVNPGFPGYLQHHVDDKEQYIYRGAYMDCIRAVDFLYSRVEVDTSRVAVEGGSQGGALSFATAALDNQRINFCLPHVPFLSDFKDYFKVAHWPANEFALYFEEHPEVTEEEIFKNLSYIDIKNLAPWIKAPVIMTIGLVDETCPPHINFAAYNLLNVPKEYRVYPDAGHSMPQEYHTLKYNYIRKEFTMQ
jgi:cephalosporin-C deacetylase